MRPPRIAIIVFFLTASLFLLFRSLSSPPRSAGSSSTYPATSRTGHSKSQTQTTSSSQKSQKAWRFMYNNTPFPLFPPNAAISLTDDNSTSFAARPAAFGPKLAARGLSGQLWVGNGFAEDTLGSGAELGCGDLPGWDKGIDDANVNKALREAVPQAAIPRLGGPNQSKKRRAQNGHDGSAPQTRSSSASVYANTGADAQTIHTAHSDDMKGKIVLLMRGGCGFLDKVMWAQRRGAIGVIVGDNQKGGPLIQMFAHGPEVDNVTIPSVFTARTTAQILSSLTQPGSFIEESIDAKGNLIFKVKRGSKPSLTKKQTKSTRSSSTSGSPFTKRSSLFLDVPSRFSRLLRWVRPTAETTMEAQRGLEKRLAKTARSPFSGEDNNEGVSDASGNRNTFVSKVFTENEEYENDSDNMPNQDLHVPGEPEYPAREGLWVTITPTSSASPFFDTLLVLVISPLVTLTVVYSMLILRARIRRRRWRAPKSVVERLPVRTYHTVAASPTDTPRTPSPTSSSPTTPLLQDSPSWSRTRPRTAGGLEAEALPAPSAAIPTPSTGPRKPQRNEKGAGGFSAEWKKYMGRQVECVVCLEEYVDGVSQVMSLPCGHEFHVECITPWLVTRRRTCPICKGDVVRSLAHGSSSEPHYEPYRDDSDDDEPIAEGSGARADDRESDLEQGLLPAEQRTSRGWTRPDGWLNMFSSGFAGARTRSPEDRDR